MKKIICLIVIILFCTFLYGKYIEPNNLKVHEYNVKNENIPEGFSGIKVAHFSDLLYSNNDEFVENLIQKINEENPDIVVFTGDLLTAAFKESKKEFLIQNLSKINAPLGKYYILGDNDTQYSSPILEESGFISVIENPKLIFNNDNTPIMISKLITSDEDNYVTNETYNFSILLTHEPDNYDNMLMPNGYSLVLAGHSLGGEINIPFYGQVIKQDKAKIYYNAHYEAKNKELYVTNGLGSLKTSLRLFNSPSFNVYRLNSK